MRIGDAMVRRYIATIPAFQLGGQFNPQAYERAVAMQGLSSRGFEEQVRLDLVTNQLTQAVSGSEWMAAAELAELVRLREQQREFAFLLLPVAVCWSIKRLLCTIKI